MLNDYLCTSRILCRWFRARRKESEIPNMVTRKLLKSRLIDDVVGEETYMTTDDIGIPVVIRQV